MISAERHYNYSYYHRFALLFQESYTREYIDIHTGNHPTHLASGFSSNGMNVYETNRLRLFTFNKHQRIHTLLHLHKNLTSRQDIKMCSNILQMSKLLHQVTKTHCSILQMSKSLHLVTKAHWSIPQMSETLLLLVTKARKDMTGFRITTSHSVQQLYKFILIGNDTSVNFFVFYDISFD